MSSDTSPAAHRPVSNRTPVELAGAIYGTILVTALIAALSEDEGADPLEIGAAVILSTLVFWLAHVYARLLAIQVSERRLSIAEVRDTAVEEWPMVQSVALPVAVLVLAPVGILSDDTAESIAIGVGVGALFFWGLMYGHREGLPLARLLLVGAVNAAFGLVIVGLKVVVH